MKNKKDLEEKIKDKVSSILEETMEKSWGITIPKVESDITDKLKGPRLNIYVSLDLTFQEAKKKFKAEFLKRELRLHKGNISQLAKFLGLDRRSIHRAIKNLEINLDEIHHQHESKEKYQQEIVDKAIRSSLDQYKSLIQPQQMEKIYQEVPTLSRNIAKFLPHQEFTWKEAECEFEKQFLTHALNDNKWKITEAANKIDIRPETLHRKIKKLRLAKHI
ncbi:MAG: helix-turn-helix domain-containing protein [Nanoarchaeota archaeon]|nr:hypothetical protein [Nanoarchaeota archaeon]MBU1631670.1 hypothetical protein [Nanoarchaeota archaeon]MBU1875640.1 hypothetical protein [Nanoarchaeota archaeon]